MHTFAQPQRSTPEAGREVRSALRQQRPIGATNEAPPIVYEALQSPGQPLDTPTRAFFEPRFGHEFGRVRIHSDTKAARSTRAVNALAYTVGQDLVFGAGQFSPRSSAGKELLAHELAHAVQQTAISARPLGRLTVTSPGDGYEREADRVSSAVAHGAAIPAVQKASPTLVARKPDPVQPATEEDRRQVVDAAARWLTAMADQVQGMRQMAAVALATTPGSAAGPRAFHRYLNQEVLGRLLNNTISVFEAQRSDNPYINFPVESPEQTRLGEAYARAIEQFGLAIEEAAVNAPNLAPAVEETEASAYARNKLRWLEANPSTPLGAGLRTTFTQTEQDLSARRHQQVSTELTNLAATVHRFNLAGDGAQRLRSALLGSTYRLVKDPASGNVEAKSDATLQATIQPILDQLSGIEWAVSEAISRLDRAEARTRAFAADPTANQADGDKLQTHFATRDPGYATLLADRFARMARELRGQGSLFIHARNPQDPECTVGSIGGGLSVTAAHAEPNHFYFCQSIRVGEEERVSTVVHETVHAVIPSLGARGPVASTADTPRDRSYASERIYSHLSTEEALDNAESYSFYVDDLLGVQVQRPSAPQDTVTGCADAAPVHDAIARATYRIRLAAMWAEQTLAEHGATLPGYIVTIVQHGFPGADAARAQGVLTHLRNLAGTLDYYLPVVCRTATDTEARAGALVYGPRNTATAGGVGTTSRAYPAGTLRICPAWFPATPAVREDALTSILVLRYRGSVPIADIAGLVALARHIQEEAHPSVATRTLQQHQATDPPP